MLHPGRGLPPPATVNGCRSRDGNIISVLPPGLLFLVDNIVAPKKESHLKGQLAPGMSSSSMTGNLSSLSDSESGLELQLEAKPLLSPSL